MSKPDMPSRRVAPAVVRYGLSVLSVALSLAATSLLQPYVFRTPLFFLSIMVSTWVGGTGPGLFAVLLSAVSMSVFLNPQGAVATRFHDVPNLAAFPVSALLVGSWSAARKRAETLLRQARDELEAKVQEQTADLRRSNERLRREIAERGRAHAEREQLLMREQAAHAEAIAAQQRFADLVNAVEGIVWEADAETFVFSFVSEQAQRILDYPIARWLNEPTFWKDHLHPDDRGWAMDFCLHAAAGKRACVIVDVRMPRMRGLELQRHLAAIQCPVPLIFITAHGDDEARARALCAGAVDFLYKPFSEEVLLRAIQAALQAARDGGAGTPC